MTKCSCKRTPVLRRCSHVCLLTRRKKTLGSGPTHAAIAVSAITNIPRTAARFTTWTSLSQLVFEKVKCRCEAAMPPCQDLDGNKKLQDGMNRGGGQ